MHCIAQTVGELLLVLLIPLAAAPALPRHKEVTHAPPVTMHKAAMCLLIEQGCWCVLVTLLTSCQLS
jgi:hypothetical protein